MSNRDRQGDESASREKNEREKAENSHPPLSRTLLLEHSKGNFHISSLYTPLVGRSNHLLRADKAVKLLLVLEQSERKGRLFESRTLLVGFLCGSRGIVVADARIETGHL